MQGRAKAGFRRGGRKVSPVSDSGDAREQVDPNLGWRERAKGQGRGAEGAGKRKRKCEQGF